MTYQSTMTVKGQVTVPKAVRDALGLRPGELVEFDTNEAGETVIRATADGGYEQRKAEIMQSIREAQRRFKAQDTMPGISTDEYMELVRGPPAEV